mgnify:CR=1 FL=1
MKIVVCGNDGDAWWEVRSSKNKTISVSHNVYSRLSDAKRGADRFEQKLWEAYIRADEGKVDGGCIIPVEVLK